MFSVKRERSAKSSAPERTVQAAQPAAPAVTPSQRAALLASAPDVPHGGTSAPEGQPARRRRRLKRPVRRALRLLVLLAVALFFVERCGGCGSWQESCAPVKPKPVAEDSVLTHSRRVDSLLNGPRAAVAFTHADGSPVKNRILGVGDFGEAFPDMNDVQLATARRLGISPIADRAAAQHRRDSLVYIGDNPFIHVQHLSHSIPYLVPRAERLLTEISRSFIDSLRRKGLPFYKPVVTSVLRTAQDVKRLRRVNENASERSCHQYGTTFDICYNHFLRVLDPDDPSARQVWDGKLKETLAEVLRDQRRLGTCYVRYERRQACFHITAR